MKCKTTARMINLVFISLIAILIMVAPVLVQANSNQTVNATIKLSVCGDDIVEGSEDCEGSNLNGKACASLGYAGGDLTCDIACTFDTSSCIAPTPTPTPSPTPTLTPTPTPTPTTTTTTSSVTSTPAELPTTTPTTSASPIPKPALPPILSLFDIDVDSKITLGELYPAVKQWVDEWKNALLEEITVAKGEGTGSKGSKKCDINNDGTCSLKDFSVLMFYVER